MLKASRPLKSITFAAILFLLLGISVAPNFGMRAEAAGTGALTVVASGGSAASPTTWDYNNGLLELKNNTSIDASVIVGYLSSNLIIEATSITVNSSIVSNTSSDITLRATGNINLIAGVQIVTTGGDIILQSNSDSTSDGSIELGEHNDLSTGKLTSNGGNIYLGGGSNIATGYAVASDDFSRAPNAKPTAGVASYGFDINAGGGDITVRGSTERTTTSSRGVIFENNAVAGQSGYAKFQTSGAGSIRVTGDGSGSISQNPWGVAMVGVVFTSGLGEIQVTGTSNTNRANARGIASSNAIYTSTSGDITLNDLTNGSASLVNYSGSFFGAPNSFTTTGNVAINSDEIYALGVTLTFSTPSAIIKSYTSSSFTATTTFGPITATNSDSLKVGETGNTSALIFSGAVSVGGPFTVNGSAITLNAAITATNQVFTINASGAVTQSAAVSVGSLALNGAGPFTLTNASNSFGTLAGGTNLSPIGAVNLVDSLGSLTIGQVAPYSGLYSTGVLEIATTVGDISVTQPVSSTATSTDSIKLFANKPTASGTAGTGNVTFSGSGNTSVAGSSRALMYSGSSAASTGAVSEVGGVSNVRTLVGATTNLSGVSPALSTTGKYLLLRVNDPQTITFAQPADKALSVGSYTETATATSGLTVVLTSLTSSTCTVSGFVVTLVAAGTCQLTASQAGDSTYASAAPITRTFNITTSAPQAITFAQPTDKFVGETFASAATSDSGLTVTLTSSTTGVCTVSGLNITTVAAGTCTIVASQSGGASSGAIYAAATSVTRGFVVSIVLVVVAPSGPLAYRIDFNPGAGAGYMNPQYAYPLSPFSLYPNLYKKDGYSFTGWNTKADGSGTSYVEGSLFTVTSGDVNLYAQWKLIQTKPTITWPTPIAIEEGTAISPTQLNALASVPGTYTYAPAAAALLPVGKHTLKVTFVPTDPKFETIETTVEIEVLAKVKVTWTNPSPIVEGTPLSSTQLNKIATVPGTFTYTPATGTVLLVGTQTLNATFKPTDTRLSSVTTQVTIVVTAKPIVIPTAPVEPTSTLITSKQKVFFAMSSFVLNAKAKADLTTLAKKVLASGSSFSVTVQGFTQPTAKDPNFKDLANNRAKAAASYIRSLGIKGVFFVKGAGQAPKNVSKSRYAEVNIVVTSK